MTAPWFPQSTVDAPVRLFCLPYAGGNATAFRHWQRLLAPHVEVVPVRLPGRLGRLAEPPFTRMPDLVAALSEAMFPLLDRPYALFGVSMGAHVAFETARVLTARSRPPVRLFVASYPSPSSVIDRDSGSGSGEDLPDAEFAARLEELGAIPPQVLRDEELMRLLLPSVRADFAVTGNHVDDGAVLTGVPVTAIHGVDDRAVDADDMRRWADKTGDDFEFTQVDGDHFFVHSHESTLFTLLRDRLARKGAHVGDDLSGRLAALSPDQRRRLRDRLQAAGRAAEGEPSRKGPRWSLFFFGTGHGRATREQYRMMLDCARFADRNGFEALWVPERHFDSFGAPYPSPAVLAASLATATERLRIRAGSVVLPLHDPVRVAEDWAVVDNISGGRAGIALASGWHANDFVFQPDNYEKRKEVLVDHLAVLRELLAGGRIQRVDGAGKEISFRTFPNPDTGTLPMWITSSSSEQTWRTGAELGLHVLTGLVEQSVADVADRVRVYHEALREHGRDPADHTVTAMVHTFIGKDTDDVRAMVREPLTAYLRAHINLYEKLARSTDLSIDPDRVTQADKDALAALAFERYFTSHGLFGTPAEALPMVRRLTGAGVDEIACLIDFGLPAETVLDHLEHLARLRDLASEPVP
ncbi:MAG: MupA/Atu3671 family FMN-dependent luciferase-like monooxygenase [Actinophytocola sp.]|uniref:MupA/Atu3671 family FMN-dependent luciferase-like monooxygenase n=1 Tax=Actinophytocola sp. TaxID=1872138 RepID=UPI003C77FDD2